MAAGRSGDPKSQILTGDDLRTVDKVLRRLKKLHRLSTDPRMGLRNSPPYFPDLVSETMSMIWNVWEPYYDSGMPSGYVSRGDEAKYLRVHLRNMLDKTDRALRLFRDGQEEIFEETSSCRRNLVKLSLLFSHMLWEFKVIFPGHFFQGDTYRVTKKEAREFWRHSFGDKCIVKWRSFEEKLQRVHFLDGAMESLALKSTIDLTCNSHISVFEFDIFTRLFQPWKSLIRNWKQLAVTHPGYMAFLTYDQVVARLQRFIDRPGSYIFRPSCTNMGEWAIGHVAADGNIVQTIPQNMSLYFALIEGCKAGSYLYPNGQDANPDLSSLREPTVRDTVKVTMEQYQQYCEIGSSFQLCKICSKRDKNTRVKPCGHLLCKLCLVCWQQKSASFTCPHCHRNIQGTEPVFIEPFLAGPREERKEEEEEDEEDEEEDHEDIELVVRAMAAQKKLSSQDLQHPEAHPCNPPPPLRNISVPLSKPPTRQPAHREIQRSRQQLQRCAWENMQSDDEATSDGKAKQIEAADDEAKRENET